MNILTISPHTDDTVFGLGATIAKWVRQGHEIHEIALTDLGREDLRSEFNKSCKILGIKSNHILNYDVRNFNVRRQDVLQDMIDLIKDINPERVLVPCGMDVHQDHGVVYNEAMRAFKKCSVWGYELTWNTYTMSFDIISVVAKEDMVKKLVAIECYQSQKHRPYFNADKVMSLAISYGMKINEEYAEIFECIRMIER